MGDRIGEKSKEGYYIQKGIRVFCILNNRTVWWVYVLFLFSPKVAVFKICYLKDPIVVLSYL